MAVNNRQRSNPTQQADSKRPQLPGCLAQLTVDIFSDLF